MSSNTTRCIITALVNWGLIHSSRPFEEASLKNKKEKLSLDRDLFRVFAWNKNRVFTPFKLSPTGAPVWAVAWKNLTQLRLGDCVPISGVGFAAFEGHKNLTWLSLNYCHRLTNEGLAQIAKLKNLTYLDITYSPRLNDKSLKYLENLKKLKTLDVSRCFFTEKALQRLRRKLPGCKIINNRPAT